jgi:hypothetical protein
MNRSPDAEPLAATQLAATQLAGMKAGDTAAVAALFAEHGLSCQRMRQPASRKTGTCTTGNRLGS